MLTYLMAFGGGILAPFLLGKPPVMFVNDLLVPLVRVCCSACRGCTSALGAVVPQGRFGFVLPLPPLFVRHGRVFWIVAKECRKVVAKSPFKGGVVLNHRRCLSLYVAKHEPFGVKDGTTVYAAINAERCTTAL